MNPDNIFRYVLLMGFLALLCIGIIHRLRAGTGEALDRRQEGLFLLVGIRLLGLTAWAALVLYFLNPAWLGFAAVGLPIWLRWAGVGLGILTGLLLFWTLQNLGRNLTDTVVTRREHSLVTTGPYKWVRHPFYVCAALVAVATTLISANLCFLVIGTVILFLLRVRTPIEERNLLSRFGEEYQDYMRRTGRFFPRL